MQLTGGYFKEAPQARSGFEPLSERGVRVQRVTFGEFPPVHPQTAALDTEIQSLQRVTFGELPRRRVALHRNFLHIVELPPVDDTKPSKKIQNSKSRYGVSPEFDVPLDEMRSFYAKRLIFGVNQAVMQEEKIFRKSVKISQMVRRYNNSLYPVFSNYVYATERESSFAASEKRLEKRPTQIAQEEAKDSPEAHQDFILKIAQCVEMRMYATEVLQSPSATLEEISSAIAKLKKSYEEMSIAWDFLSENPKDPAPQFL